LTADNPKGGMGPGGDYQYGYHKDPTMQNGRFILNNACTKSIPQPIDSPENGSGMTAIQRKFQVWLIN